MEEGEGGREGEREGGRRDRERARLKALKPDSTEAIGRAENPMDLDCETDLCGAEEVCYRTVTLCRLLQRERVRARVRY